MVNRRMVVTGIGLVSPLGIGTEANERALCAGQSGLDTITKFDAAQFSTRIEICRRGAISPDSGRRCFNRFTHDRLTRYFSATRGRPLHQAQTGSV